MKAKRGVEFLKNPTRTSWMFKLVRHSEVYWRVKNRSMFPHVITISPLTAIGTSVKQIERAVITSRLIRSWIRSKRTWAWWGPKVTESRRWKTSEHTQPTIKRSTCSKCQSMIKCRRFHSHLTCWRWTWKIAMVDVPRSKHIQRQPIQASQASEDRLTTRCETDSVTPLSPNDEMWRKPISVSKRLIPYLTAIFQYAYSPLL